MRVLVGVEDSEGARVALRWAADLARVSGGTLVAAQAWQYPLVPLIAERERLAPADELDVRVEADVARLVEEELGAVDGREVEVACRALRGPAAHALRAAIGELAIDVVVVGARGLTPTDQRLLGSVSRSIAEDAPCPVAVVPAQLGHTEGPIVVGVDGSDDARVALQWAGDAAAAVGAEVVLVHGFGPYGAELPPEALADDQEHGEQLVAAYQDICESKGVKHRSVVRVRDARSLLEEVGEGEHARMVVVGARGTGKLAKMLLGSVSSYLVLNLRRPTVIVHPR